MKLRTIIKSSLIALLATGLIAAFGFSNVNAQQIPYVPGESLPAPTTPAFNIYTNVPAGVGNEADFVKLRKSTGDPTVPAASSNFIDPVNASCKAGDKFDIRTYVHNGADEESNNNGNGPAVARNVRVNMNAPLNQNGTSFTFDSTIHASNAASVADTGRLNCGNNVQLELVPQTVRVYSKFYGWQNAPDSAVNGSLTIGSRQVASGNVWGCWEDRVVVVYVVRVKEVPPVVQVAECDALSATVYDNRRVRAIINATAQNVSIVGYRIDFGDGTVVNQREAEHTYSQDGEYNIRGSVQFDYGQGRVEWVTSDDCATVIKADTPSENCPIPGKEHLPKDSPECVTKLPETGVGSIAGIFAAVSAAGTAAYQVVTRRKQ